VGHRRPLSRSSDGAVALERRREYSTAVVMVMMVVIAVMMMVMVVPVMVMMMVVIAVMMVIPRELQVRFLLALWFSPGRVSGVDRLQHGACIRNRIEQLGE